MSAKQNLTAVNRTKHDLSTSELRELGGRAPAGATKMEVLEPEHEDVTRHVVQLVYTTPQGRFLFCQYAGGDFSAAMDRLKTCKNEAVKF